MCRIGSNSRTSRKDKETNRTNHSDIRNSALGVSRQPGEHIRRVKAVRRGESERTQAKTELRRGYKEVHTDRAVRKRISELKITYNRSAIYSNNSFLSKSNCDEAFDINAKIQAYLKYLDFEIKQVKDLENAKVVNNDKLNKQRLRVKCLFERAIGDQTLCLSSQLWTKYINFCVHFL